MEYEVVKTKSDEEFVQMSLEEAKEYYSWYLKQIETRLPRFIQYVKSFAGFEDWEAVFSPESLKALGRWLAQNIETRKHTQEELLELYNSFWEISRKTYPDLDTWLKKMHIDDWTLNDKSFSYCLDISLYFAKVLLRAHPSLKWRLERRGPKRNIYRNRPVLEGFIKKDVFAPLHMMTVQAFGLADRTFSENTLYELFQIWNKMVEK